MCMDRIIPELKGQEKNTLYVIGNGFDMYHGLKTSYHDFHDWLKSNHYSEFILDLEKMFPTLSNNEPLLWKDFEAAIGNFDLLSIHKEFFQGKDDGFYDEDVSKMVVNRISPTINDIPKLLRNWLKDIDVFEVKNRLKLSWDSLFLSFNYTMLLENVYSIPKNRVLHIHNSLGGNEKLITGHNSEVSSYEAEKLCFGANEEQSVQLIAQEMTNLIKPVDQQMKQHMHFFNSLQNISNVVVFGHSLSMIDRPYLTHIQRNIQDFAHWYFICKDDGSITNCKKYVKLFNNRRTYRVIGVDIEEEGLCKKMLPENCKYFKKND